MEERRGNGFKAAMFGICAAFVALVIAVVLLTNADLFRGSAPEESQAGSLPPGQVGYDLQGFIHDESFFDDDPTLPFVEVLEGTPEEGTEGYTHVDPEEKGIGRVKSEETAPEKPSDDRKPDEGKMPRDDGKAPQGAADKGKETERHGKAGSTDL